MNLSANPHSPRAGDIGEGQREIELEPLTTPVVPEPLPATTPAPAREPEQVPA